MRAYLYRIINRFTTCFTLHLDDDDDDDSEQRHSETIRTTCSGVLLAMLTVPQLVKKFPAFYGA
jgi:hypothetical protein